MKFDKNLFERMLETAFAVIRENTDYLNQLDSGTGDGDHGTAAHAAYKAAAESAKKEDGTLAAVLEAIGWNVMSSASGSTSSLTGAFFLGMGQKAVADELSVDQTIEMFEAGLANVQGFSKALVGDKTLMDALIPAIDAMGRLKGTGASFVDVFQAAAEAAQKGADSTKDLVAKHGRAKNLGERSRGHLDAGAISTALVYQAYAKVIAQ